MTRYERMKMQRRMQRRIRLVVEAGQAPVTAAVTLVTAPALAVCATCPVREPCLDFALRTRQHGKTPRTTTSAWLENVLDRPEGWHAPKGDHCF